MVALNGKNTLLCSLFLNFAFMTTIYLSFYHEITIMSILTPVPDINNKTIASHHENEDTINSTIASHVDVGRTITEQNDESMEEQTKETIQKRPEFLLLQCMAHESMEDLIRYQDEYSIYIETIKYYAWYHGYTYHLELVDMKHMSIFLGVYHINKCRNNHVCRQLFKTWCLEKMLIKFNPKWLVHFDIDMAIAAPKMFIPLDVQLQNVINHYNHSYSSLEDVSFVCSSGPWDMNTGLMFFHNQNRTELSHNKWYKLLDGASVHVGDGMNTGTIFDSPFIQTFFDINKYVWFRDFKNVSGGMSGLSDQISMMEVMLVAADYWYHREHGITEYTMYNHECMRDSKSGPEYNGCWWHAMNEKYNYTPHNRQFGPYILLHGDMEMQQRGRYHPGHFVWHYKSNNKPKQWYPQYKLMFDHPELNDVNVSKEIIDSFEGIKWNKSSPTIKNSEPILVI